MASLSLMSIPASANAAILPGSRPRGSGGGGTAAHVWPNPLPLECGVIRLLLEKQAAAKQGGAGVGQKFQSSVSLCTVFAASLLVSYLFYTLRLSCSYST